MTRMIHMASKVNATGDVSALCFDRPRVINLEKESWSFLVMAVTCQKCLSKIMLRTKYGETET